MYEGELLLEMQEALLEELHASPWFRASRGCNHVLVWTSQRPVERLLGPRLTRLLRHDSHVRFLAVEDVDGRLGTLRFQQGRDVKIPPYTPSHIISFADKARKTPSQVCV